MSDNAFSIERIAVIFDVTVDEIHEASDQFLEARAEADRGRQAFVDRLLAYMGGHCG